MTGVEACALRVPGEAVLVAVSQGAQLEGGGRLVVSVNDAEAKELHDVLGGVVNAS